MADFDKDLNPIIKPTGYKATNIPIDAAKDIPMNFSSSGGGGVSDLSQKEDIFSKLAAAGQKFEQKGIFISNAELDANKRYKTFNPTIGDYEDFAAQGQDWYKQAANGVLKGVNLAATTVAGGFGTLYGIGKALLPGGKFSDIYQNEIMTSLDEWNNKVDNEFLPNYYTAAERNSEWYSTDNWFTTNFLFDKLIKNAGFAVGAMVGGNIANTGLLALGKAAGSLAAKGATIAQASQGFKAFTPLLRNTARAFSAGKNAEAAALLESQISSIADLSAKSSTLANISKQTTQFAKFSDAARRTAVATYSSAGEASFEALQTSKEFRENLIEEYTRENGYAPSGKDLEDIDMESRKVGKTSFLGNMALLAITEYVQLPHLIGSNYNASKQAANSLLGKVDDFATDEAGKYVAKAGPKTKFGKLYSGVKRAGAYVIDPKESLQETLQFALQVGTQNYFKKSKEGGEADLLVDGFLYGLFGKDELGEGVGAFVSKEGIEGGILGGITGGLMQARGTYQERKSLAQNTQAFLTMMNGAPSFKEAYQDKLAGTNRGVVLQQQHRDAIINGEKLEEKDLFTDLMHNYLSPRIKYGRFDMVMEDLKELKSGGLTEQGLSELKQQGMANINDTVETFQKRISTLENSAKSLNNVYQALNIRYAGEVIDGTNERKYPPLIIDMLAYAGTKIANYDVRIPELNSKLLFSGINTQAILQDIIETGTPNAEATKEALSLINSMNVTSDVKDELKGVLDDVIELSLRRKMFIEEYDGFKNNPLNYVRPEEEIDDVEVNQKEGRKKVKKVIEVGKTYSLSEPITVEKGKIVLAPKFTLLSSTLGGEYEVQLPDGSTTFFSPEQFDKYNIAEEDNTSQEFENALNQAIDDVLNLPANSNITKPEEGQNKLAYINSLGNQKLTKQVVSKFNKLTKEIIEAKQKEKEIAEALKANQELKKQQEDLSDKDAIELEIIPDSVGLERVDTGETGALKTAAQFFDSTTTESEEFNDPAKSANHIRRSRVFLNNVRKFKNRSKIRAIVFTYNQEEKLGLSGITGLSYNMTKEQIDADPDFKNKVTDADNGFVAMVFVEVDGNKRYFINEKGERVGEVGKKADLGKVVFQTMASTSLSDSKGNDRYRTAKQDEKEAFIKFSQIWKKRREKLINGTDTPMLEFTVSKGFPVTQKENGVFKKAAVTDELIDNKTLATVPGVINVATGTLVTHNGTAVTTRKGYVYFQDGEIIQYLNNNKLGKDKATTVYHVVKSVVTKLRKDASEGKIPRFEENKILFLKNILNYKSSEKNSKDNQIWFDVENSMVKIGNTSYSFSEIERLESEMINKLSDVYHSANSKTLVKKLNDKFYEYYFENGKLEERVWANYQLYLVSGKDSTGKNARPVSEIPFVTINNPTEAQPYPYAGKYATLTNFTIDGENYTFTETEKKEEKDPPKKTEGNSQPGTSEVIEQSPVVKVGKFTLNDGSLNTITIGFEFSFKADILPNGQVTIITSSIDDSYKKANEKTFQNFANNEKMLEVAKKIYASSITEELTDTEIASIFYLGQAKSQIEKEIQAQEAAKKEAEEIPQSDLDAQIATLEEKRIDELSRTAVADGTALTYRDSAVAKAIDDRYNKELAKLQQPAATQESKEEAKEEIEATKPEDDIVSFKGRKKKYDDDETRKVSDVGEVGGRMTDAEIEIFKKWHKENVPNIPFEVLDKIITLHDGAKAWGVFEQGVAKFFKRGLKGTEYHEVFEGIWKAFLTEGERQALITEFKSKKGNFLDRESGKYIVYSEATDRQVKERIADDFADYRLGKISATTLSQKIKNFFKSIMEFFKSFVQKPSMKEDLFKAIDAGKFKDYTVPEYIKSATPEYRLKYTPDGKRFTEDQVHAFVQDVTLTTAQYIFNRNNDGALGKLFKPEATSGKEIYNHLRDVYSEYIEDIGDDLFDFIFLRTKDLFKTIGVSIDTDGITGLNDSNKTDRLYSNEAFEVDFKKNARFAVKFLLATNPLAKKEYKLGEALPEFIKSKLEGLQNLKLMSNYNRSFATLLSKLSNTSLQKFDKNLIDLAIADGNYYRIVTRLKGDPVKGEFNYSQFTKDDWRFYIQFVQAFVKSNPEVEVATIRGTGVDNESYSSLSDRMSAVTTTRNEWFQNVQKLGESESSYIVKTKNENNKIIYIINDKHEYYPTIKGLFESTSVLSSYLKNIGININDEVIREIYKNETLKKEFDQAVVKIYEYGSKEFANLTGNKFVGINSSILKIADIYVRTINPDQDTTRLNIENQRASNYSDSNSPSVFEAQFNESNSLEELLQVRPELNDQFSQNSLLLKKGGLFFDENGKKKKNAVLKIGVIEGLRDENSDNGTSISSLTKGDRFTVEINQNIKGNYYILIPADSETERTFKLGTFINYESFNDDASRAFKEISEIYKSYLEDEIDLALDWQTRSELAATKENAKQLRFFRDILDADLVEKIEEAIERGDSKSEILKIVKDNNSSFEQSIRTTLENINKQVLQDLIDTGEVIISPLNEKESGYTYQNLSSEFANDNKIDRLSMSQDQIMQVLSFVNTNQMIANMEMHKFIFGDPYQFKIKNGKLDETKRIKSWLSPRKITIDTPELNKHLNENYNNASDEIELDPNDIFHYTFKPFVKTATLNDVNPVSRFIEGFEGYDEGDGFSIMIDGAYREVKLKNGDNFSEEWFQWNQSYARQKMSAKGTYEYKSEALRKHDEATIKKPQPSFVTEVLKPIVSGSKFGVSRIEGVLDKFSQMPITYKMVEGTNLENLYVQMLNEKVGYVVYKSGRKEGVRKGHSVYTQGGQFNNTAFDEQTIENVAWSTYGIQLENTYEEGGAQTRGSQLNKNDTMDMYDNGKEAEGFEGINALAKEKIKIFKEMHENAFGEFLEKLGLENLNGEYRIADRVKISKELEYELLRRQISQNAIDTIRLDENGQFKMPFEASAEYEQIRSVLISMVNKSLISPAMNGKAHVQVPATMWENAAKGRKLLRKIGKKYIEINRTEYEALSDTDKATVVLASDTLKFYEDVEGKRHMEIMIPNFWKKYFTDKKRFPNDKAIFEYLNKPENQKILFGVGFRIPHQAMSSTEVFKIAGFLDASMGSTVVVPSEIVAKAGSDFDIDKLNMYLKSVFVDQNGDVKLIEYKGSKEATIDFYEKMFVETVQKELIDVWNDDRFGDDLVEFFDEYELIENVEELDAFDLKNALGEEMFTFYAKRERTIRAMIDKATEENIKPSEYIANQIGKLANKAAKLNLKKLNDDLKRDYAKRMYKKSLENRYYEVLQETISLPGNFDRLMSPVGDAGLSKDADAIDKVTNDSEADIKNKLISRSYMASLRHAFLIAKRWVGIAAVNITGHAIGQKVGLYFDSRLTEQLSEYDRSFLIKGEEELNLTVPHNTVEVDGKKMISLGGRTTADGLLQFISDRLSGYATAFVDVAKDPYILKLLRSNLVVGTAMLMERIGVGGLTPYFLNQPMIVEYLKLLDRNKSRGLFGKDNLEEIRAMFPIGTSEKSDMSDLFVKDENGVVDFEKSKGNMLNIIGEYSNSKGAIKTTDFQFNAKQRAIFDEFLKLSKLAQLNFKFSQAYNYDTTRVRNYEGFKRKMLRTAAAQETNIISSVDKVMNQTFIGDQMTLIRKELKALGAIMKLDSKEIEIYIDEVMEPFYNDEYMSEDDFNFISKKLKNSFLDFVIQLKSENVEMSNYKDLLVGKKSVASRLLELKKQEKYKNSDLLNNLTPFASLEIDGPVTVMLKVKPVDPIDINRYIGLMLELKENEPEFYNDLVLVSILQGVSNSSKSISSIIPLEDRAAIITPVINALKPSLELDAFSENGLFFRNNFRDDRIVPETKIKFQVVNYRINFNNGIHVFLPTQGILPTNPRVIKLNNKYSFSNNSDRDVVKVKRYQINGSVVLDFATGKQLRYKEDYKRMVTAGEISPSELIGYMKVKSKDGTPLTIQEVKGKKVEEYSIFKMINLYGSSGIVAEYPKLMRPSQFKNNTYAVKEELTNESVISMFSDQSTESTIIPQAPQVSETTSSKVERTTRIINRSELRSNPKTLYLFGDNDVRKGLGGQAKEMRNEPNAIGISTKKLPATSNQSYKTDIELDQNKKIISEDINRAIVEWNTGKYDNLIIPPMGIGLAELPTRAPQTFAFLQQELQRLENYINDSQTPQVPKEEVVENNKSKTTTIGKYTINDIRPSSKVVKVNQYNITVQSDGKMYFQDGKEVTDQTIKNKVDIKVAFQNGTLKISIHNKNKYFVLLDGRILGSGKTNLGKESVSDPEIKKSILAKAVTYKKECP